MDIEDFNENTMEYALEWLHNDKESSDLTVKVGNKEFRVHKVILMARSQYFRNCLRGEFREANSSLIFLEGEKPEVIKYLLEYIYRDSYILAEIPGEDPMPVLDAKIFAAADKYMLPRLYEYARESFERSTADVLGYPQDTCCLLELVALLYGEGPPIDQLRLPFLETFRRFIDKWQKRSEFQEAITTIPGFTFDLIKYLAKK